MTDEWKRMVKENIRDTYDSSLDMTKDIDIEKGTILYIDRTTFKKNNHQFWYVIVDED